MAAIREEMTVQLPGQKGVREHIAVGDLARVSCPSRRGDPCGGDTGRSRAMRSRFALLRVRAAKREPGRREERPFEWLLIEWPTTEAAPIKFWLCNLPAGTRIAKIVNLAQMRWRVERDYEELKRASLASTITKGEDGSASIITVLCIAAYAFSQPSESAFPPPHFLSFLRTRFPYLQVSARGEVPAA